MTNRVKSIFLGLAPFPTRPLHTQPSAADDHGRERRRKTSGGSPPRRGRPPAPVPTPPAAARPRAGREADAHQLDTEGHRGTVISSVRLVFVVCRCLLARCRMPVRCALGKIHVSPRTKKSRRTKHFISFPPHYCMPVGLLDTRRRPSTCPEPSSPAFFDSIVRACTRTCDTLSTSPFCGLCRWNHCHGVVIIIVLLSAPQLIVVQKMAVLELIR